MKDKDKDRAFWLFEERIITRWGSLELGAWGVILGVCIGRMLSP